MLAAMVASQLPAEGQVVQDIIYAVIFFSVLLSNLMSFRIEKGGLVWVGKALFRRHANASVEVAEQAPAAEVSGKDR